MVEHNRELDVVFRALASSRRRAILTRLEGGRATVGELAEPFGVSLNAVSKHVKALERAGLVDREVRGREHWLKLNVAPLRGAGEWIARYERFWRGRLDALESMFAEERPEE